MATLRYGPSPKVTVSVRGQFFLTVTGEEEQATAITNLVPMLIARGCRWEIEIGHRVVSDDWRVFATIDYPSSTRFWVDGVRISGKDAARWMEIGLIDMLCLSARATIRDHDARRYDTVVDPEGRI